MGISQYMPALIITFNDIFIGAVFGFILSLPIALFLAFWMSDVKNRGVVVMGAFIGAFIGLLIILGWTDTLIFDTPLPGANSNSTFWGSLFFCTTLGLVGGIVLDLIVASRNARDYRRQAAVHQ
jgi:hypothetical protein